MTALRVLLWAAMVFTAVFVLAAVIGVAVMSVTGAWGHWWVIIVVGAAAAALSIPYPFIEEAVHARRRAAERRRFEEALHHR